MWELGAEMGALLVFAEARRGSFAGDLGWVIQGGRRAAVQPAWVRSPAGRLRLHFSQPHWRSPRRFSPAFHPAAPLLREDASAQTGCWDGLQFGAQRLARGAPAAKRRCRRRRHRRRRQRRCSGCPSHLALLTLSRFFAPQGESNPMEGDTATNATALRHLSIQQALADNVTLLEVTGSFACLCNQTLWACMCAVHAVGAQRMLRVSAQCLHADQACPAHACDRPRACPLPPADHQARARHSRCARHRHWRQLRSALCMRGPGAPPRRAPAGPARRLARPPYRYPTQGQVPTWRRG